MKNLYLPEAHNDSIFAFVVSAEVLAVMGGAVMLLVLMAVIVFIIRNKRKGGKL